MAPLGRSEPSSGFLLRTNKLPGSRPAGAIRRLEAENAVVMRASSQSVANTADKWRDLPHREFALGANWRVTSISKM